MVAVFAAASGTFALFGTLGPGCTPSATALCDRICECTGCSDSQRADCVDDLEDAEKAADEAGCSLEFNDVARCFDEEFECRNDAPHVDGCETETEELQRCAAGTNVGVFGDACQTATDRLIARFEECGIDVGNAEEGENPECTSELAQQSSCFADCVDVASCGALTGEDAEGSADFSECLSSCSS